MHTWFGKKHTFHFNQDFSEVIIAEQETGVQLVKMEGDELLEFVAENFIRPKLIADIENTDWQKLL